MQDAVRQTRTAGGAGGYRRQTGRLAVLLAALAMPATSPGANRPASIADVPTSSREITLRLFPTAVVASEEVTLSDVAEIQGEAAQMLGGMRVGAAPQPGRAGELELSQIQSMLSRRGVNLSQWVFRGSSRCTIRRVAPEAARPASSTRPAAAVEASGQQESLQTLEDVLRRHLSARLEKLGGTAVVRFSPALGKVLRLSRPAFDFRITDRSDRLLGMVACEVVVFEGGVQRQTVPVLADVSIQKRVAVASRPINRGETIQTGDLVLEERTFERPEEIGLASVDGLAGQRVRRFIEQKGIVFSRDIEPVPLVVRNDLVTVTARSGRLMIRGTAKAVTTGTLGETVVLKNEASKETFSAVVTGLKEAELAAGMRTGGQP